MPSASSKPPVDVKMGDAATPEKPEKYRKAKNDYFRGFKEVDHKVDHARMSVVVGKQTLLKVSLK